MARIWHVIRTGTSRLVANGLPRHLPAVAVSPQRQRIRDAMKQQFCHSVVAV